MDRVGTVIEVLQMIARRGKWVLLPAVIALVLVGALIIFAQASPLGPLIYPLF